MERATHGPARIRHHRLRHDRRVPHPGDQRDRRARGWSAAFEPVAEPTPPRSPAGRGATARSTTTSTACWPIPGLDVVCVCTPSGAHLEPAVAAARAGKHVVVEKPLEITLPRCDAIIDACDAAGVRLCTIFPSRFTPANLALKDGDRRRPVRPADAGRHLRASGGGPRSTTTRAAGAAPGSSTAAAR